MSYFIGRRLIAVIAAASVLSNCFCPCLLVVDARADTNGPGAPGGFAGCPGHNDAKGPCSDPNDYYSSGIGNGICGRCGDITYDYIGGSCTWQDNVDHNNCNDCTVSPKTFVRNYESTPVGSVAYAICMAAYVACLGAAGVLDAAVCGSVCVVSGVFTWSASCIACIAALGSATVTACDCAFAECQENCDYVGTDTSGSTSACS